MESRINREARSKSELEAGASGTGVRSDGIR